MKTTQGIKRVAQIVLKRGDATMWGADEDTLEACIQLVKEVVETGYTLIELGDFNGVQDLLQDELGLEPDYIDDLWL